MSIPIPIDAVTSAALVAFVVSVIGIFKFLIPEGPHQNDQIRALSAGLAAVVFAVASLRLPGAAGTLEFAVGTFLPAAMQGFTAGSLGTVAVKSYHVVQEKLSTPSVAVATPLLPLQTFTPAPTPVPVGPAPANS